MHGGAQCSKLLSASIESYNRNHGRAIDSALDVEAQHGHGTALSRLRAFIIEYLKPLRRRLAPRRATSDPPAGSEAADVACIIVGTSGCCRSPRREPVRGCQPAMPRASRRWRD